METFTRYFVRDVDGEVDEIYDGDDDLSLALAAAKEIGGTVYALDYISDGQYREVTEDEL